jgi:hypothetical protein
MVCVHWASSQASSVQALPSSQGIGLPRHVPSLQASPTVQPLPSLQVTPSGNGAAAQTPDLGSHAWLTHGFGLAGQLMVEFGLAAQVPA